MLSSRAVIRNTSCIEFLVVLGFTGCAFTSLNGGSILVVVQLDFCTATGFGCGILGFCGVTACFSTGVDESFGVKVATCLGGAIAAGFGATGATGFGVAIDAFGAAKTGFELTVAATFDGLSGGGVGTTTG